MKVYQINYDLRKQRDYSSLIKQIKAYQTYVNPLESCWLIATNQSSVQVRDNLASVMDADDGLLVTRLQGEAAWRMLGGNSNGSMDKWLKDQLSKAE